jgi:hypothetical protein
LNFPVWKPGFWDVWPKAKATDFAKFLKLAKKGKPMQPFRPAEGVDRKKAEQDYQMAELERSVKYCKEVIGLGLKSQTSQVRAASLSTVRASRVGMNSCPT